jgi:arylsulfatase A-like enzyme
MGNGSVEVDAALGRVDDGIGTLIECLEASGQLEETAIIVVGDIAYHPVHSSAAPNVALVQSGLIGRDPRASTGVRSWLALARSNGRSAYIYARDAANAVEARKILEVEAARTGAFRVVSAKELMAVGADPQAWFGLSAMPGYMIGNELSGPEVRPAAVRATAGALRFGNSRDVAVGFVAWGRGIRNQVRLPTIELVDVAPTIAVLLGLRLGDNLDGEPIYGLLRAETPLPPPGPKRLGSESGESTDEILREIRRSREERRIER